MSNSRGLSDSNRFSEPKLSMDGASGGGSFEHAPSVAVTTAAQIRWLLLEARVELSSPQGFYNLHELDKASSSERVLGEVGELVASLVSRRGFVPAQQLDVTDPAGVHSKIYAGQDYSQNGPVLVNAGHLKQMFSGFTSPTVDEINARVAIGKENYGTMPGTEAAYSGAMVKALQPRTIVVIGEHKGHLTKYLAECAPDDCLILTIELPQSVAQESQATPVDNINKSFVNYTQDQIGEAWRDSSVSDRIVGLAADSTSIAAGKLFSSLKGLIDLVVVDGNHAYEPVRQDLLSAQEMLSDKGVALVDDFWKPARLFEVTEAAMRVRREVPEFSRLYHLSWGVGDEAISSNLAFFIKESSGTSV